MMQTKISGSLSSCSDRKLEKYCTVQSEQDRSSRGPRNARGSRVRRRVKRSNETESGEESGNVGKRDDAVQLRWNFSRKFVQGRTVVIHRAQSDDNKVKLK